jgi:hypothetical protein
MTEQPGRSPRDRQRITNPASVTEPRGPKDLTKLVGGSSMTFTTWLKNERFGLRSPAEAEVNI